MLFQIHFQLVVRKRFHIFFIFPRNVRRKSVPFSCSFFRLCIQELKVLYIHFTRSLVHVVLGTELLQCPFFRGGQFSVVEQFLYLDTREKFVDPAPVDVALVNGRYTPGKTASRAGTGERLTGTPVVQPSFLHPSQAGVQENFRYSRKYWPWRTCSSFISSEAFQIKHSQTSMFYSARKICSIWLGIWPRRTKSASLEGSW